MLPGTGHGNHLFLRETAFQIEDANVVLQDGTVRVQTVYHNKDVVAVRFRHSGWLLSFKTFN